MIPILNVNGINKKSINIYIDFQVTISTKSYIVNALRLIKSQG